MAVFALIVQAAITSSSYSIIPTAASRTASAQVSESVEADDFVIAAAGDWGCTYYTNRTIIEIKDIQPDLVLPLGDYSYKTTMDCWHDRLTALGNEWVHDRIHNPTTIALGNHENDTCSCGASGTRQLSTVGEAALLLHFGLTGQTYYSYEKEGVHFVVLDPNIDYRKSSPQYAWVKNDLETASKDQTISWIIVYMHMPMYSSSVEGKGGNLNYTGPNKPLRETYQPLFDRNRVDLVIHAHVHAYERMKPMSYRAVIEDNHGWTYNDPRGQIYVTVGTAGKSLYRYDAKPAMSAKQFDLDDKHYGFLKLTINNDSKTLTGEFIKNNWTGTTLDTFEINHSAKYDYSPYYVYDGSSSSYTEVPDSSSLRLTDFTLAAWFQTNEDFSAPGYQEKTIIANKGGFSSEAIGKNMNYGMWIINGYYGGRIQAGFENANGADVFVQSTKKYNDGRWHYAVVTFDKASSTLTLYVDGVQVAKRITSMKPDSNGTQPFRIGANSLVLDSHFKGNADEVRVWNRAITAGEVSNAYQNGIFNTAGQVLLKDGS